ncbi:MAG: DegV family protein [Acidimicrobiales bacterium]
MGQVAVVTDSGADLPEDVALQHDIRLVPLRIRFGEIELTDRVELPVQEFWARCESSRALPSTAAPSIGDFVSCFEKAASDGYDAALCVTLASKLSATHQAAEAARREVAGSVEVQVVDSASASVGQGLLALAAARGARDGVGLGELAERIVALAGRTFLYGTLDRLDYLHRGGRIGAVASLVGSVLAFKPVIEVRDGAVELVGRPRTRSRALQTLVERATSHGPLGSLAVVHAGAPDLAELLSLLERAAPGIRPLVADLGPVIGTHTGPGTLGIGVQPAV